MREVRHGISIRDARPAMTPETPPHTWNVARWRHAVQRAALRGDSARLRHLTANPPAYTAPQIQCGACPF